MSSLDKERIGRDIIANGIYEAPGVVTDAVYELITDATPIVCVDVIPVSVAESGLLQIGVITRATGAERGKPALIGGRVKKNETIAVAIGRHLRGSFGDATYDFYEGGDEGRPFYVAQYAHAATAEGGYDPTKHSIAMTYLITMPEPTQTKDEASAFHWIGLDQIPETAAYNQQLVLQKAAEILTAE